MRGLSPDVTIVSHDWAAEVVSVTDGDTLRLHLRRTVPLVPGWRQVVEDDDPDGQPVRLVILDTPERGDPGWRLARADLAAWIAARVGMLRCETYESAGWDRLLGDLYVDGRRGDTATQHMLQLGWPSYLNPSRIGRSPE